MSSPCSLVKTVADMLGNQDVSLLLIRQFVLVYHNSIIQDLQEMFMHRISRIVACIVPNRTREHHGFKIIYQYHEGQEIYYSVVNWLYLSMINSKILFPFNTILLTEG